MSRDFHFAQQDRLQHVDYYHIDSRNNQLKVENNPLKVGNSNIVLVIHFPKRVSQF
jgi:hypothetical protein